MITHSSRICEARLNSAIYPRPPTVKTDLRYLRSGGVGISARNTSGVKRFGCSKESTSSPQKGKTQGPK